MAEVLTIRPAGGTWVVRAGGAVLGETADALELVIGANTPIIFFPRGDVAVEFLDPSETVAQTPELGGAKYFDIASKSGPIRDAAWELATPQIAADSLRGYLTFVGNKVAVEQV